MIRPDLKKAPSGAFLFMTPAVTEIPEVSSRAFRAATIP